ncbi:MAG: glutathione peroxidase [Alphaproteobacteria bacterium]|nr:glutathione peroxidase [Alphaproteobacteria bacterium]
MKILTTIIATFTLLSLPYVAHAKLMQTHLNAHQFTFETIDGDALPLADYQGKVLLIVNTASQCGFTKQYADLQILHDTYKDKGFSVIGVPCNDFGGQEPGDEQKIKEFVTEKFGITFPMTKKYSVKGENSHPFFEWAKNERKDGTLFSNPSWNFHKYLIDQNGDLVKSFSSSTNPNDQKIRSEIDALLKD